MKSSKSLSNKLRADSNQQTHEKIKSLPRIDVTQSFDARNVFSQEPVLKERDPFQRLSGNRDSAMTSGLYAEFTNPSKPISLCVRCGNTHSSLCMLCSDSIAENAVLFYRRTRAVGAASLFKKAFVEAGNSKVVKLYIFSIWKNSYMKEKRLQLKYKQVSDRSYEKSLVTSPFQAWKKFVQSEIMHRKNKTIAQLNERVDMMESQIAKLSYNNSLLEAENNHLKEQTSMQSKESKEFFLASKRYEKEQLEGKERILLLTSLIEPLLQYSSLAENLIQYELTEIRGLILHTGANSPNFNYSNFFSMADMEEVALETNDYFFALQQETVKTADPSKVTEILNTQKSMLEKSVGMQIMSEWIISTAKMAENHFEPLSGTTLGSYLPDMEALTGFEDLKSGKMLARTVLCIIYDMFKDANNSSMKGLSVGIFESKRDLIPVETLKSIKSSESDPKELVKIIMELAETYLKIPKFSSDEVVMGKTDTIYFFIVSVMIMSYPRADQQETLWLDSQFAEFHKLSLFSEEFLKEKIYHTGLNNIAKFRHLLKPKPDDVNNNEGSTNNQATITIVDNPLSEETNSKTIISDAEYKKQQKQLELEREAIYKDLLLSIDHVVKKKEEIKILEDIEGLMKITNGLTLLQGACVNYRDERDSGVHHTNSLRQYVVSTMIKQILNNNNNNDNSQIAKK